MPPVLRSAPVPAVLVCLCGVLLPAPASADSGTGDIYYSVEENGAITLSNRPRHPMPRHAVIYRGAAPKAPVPGAVERRPRSPDIPVLEICTEDGRSVACEPRE